MSTPEQDVLDYIAKNGMRKRPHKFEMCMNIAREFEKQSTCLRNQFGSIIVTNNFSTVLSVGYNGPYKGGPNHCRSLQPGKCGCLHSEQNNLIKYPYGLHENTIMFVTGNPCYMCASMIINADIKHVIYDREYTTDNFEGLNLLRSVGLCVQQLTDAISTV